MGHTGPMFGRIRSGGKVSGDFVIINGDVCIKSHDFCITMVNFKHEKTDTGMPYLLRPDIDHIID